MAARPGQRVLAERLGGEDAGGGGAGRAHHGWQAERGDNGKIWASQLKQAIKRRKPDFEDV